MSNLGYPQHELLKEQLDPDEYAHKDTTDVEIACVEGNTSIKQQDLETQTAKVETIRIMRNFGEPYPRHFGNYCVFRFKDNEPRIAIGPHWPLFLLAYLGICFGCFKLIQQTFIHFTILYQIISLLSVIALLVSYLTTALANPGIASAQYQILNEQEVIGQKKYCKPCQILRPAGTEHCYDCDVCITRLDHHCPWTGKCIGQGNIKSFYGFIISMMFFMIYSILLVFSKI